MRELRNPDETPEHRLKRLRLRSWRRGIKEMDLILGKFADERLADLDPETLDRYEAMLDENDQDLYKWVSGAGPSPEIHRAMLAEVASFHGIES